MASYSVPLSRWFYQGALAASGTVTVYQTGTTTPVTIYTDAALTTPASNPLTLDSNGEALFYAPDSLALRLLVKTSGGTTVRDIDPVYPVPNLAGLTSSPAELNVLDGNTLAAPTAWTPAFSSTAATFAYSHQIGTAVKVGRLVFLEYRLALSGAPGGTTSNTVFLTGIPYACSTLTNLYFGGSVGHYIGINLASGTSVAYQGSSAGTTFELKEVGDGLAETSLLASTLTASAEIRGSITYISA